MECEQDKQENTDPESAETVIEPETLQEMIRRCCSGDRNAFVALRRLMQDHPDLFSSLGHISAKVHTEWIRAISGPDSRQLPLI